MKSLHGCGLMVAVLSCAAACAGSGPGWSASFEAAEETAGRRSVPLLVHFHAAWCGPCRKMEQQVFSSLAVQRALQEGLVAVQVETSRRPDVAQRFGATTIPRDVVIYPDGTVETLGVGFVPPPAYLALLRDTAARGRMIALTQQEVARPTEPRTKRNPVQSVPDVVDPGVAEEIVGLSGYCPVMLTGRKQWVAGVPDLAERHRGVLYYFSDKQRRVEFRADPDHYAPRNLGCDPVVLSREQRAITGRIRYGVFFDGSLYLFRTEQNRQEFRLRPLKYTRIQHAVRPAELSGQTFR